MATLKINYFSRLHVRSMPVIAIVFALMTYGPRNCPETFTLELLMMLECLGFINYNERRAIFVSKRNFRR
jgi:hypothetical protein